MQSEPNLQHLPVPSHLPIRQHSGQGPIIPCQSGVGAVQMRSQQRIPGGESLADLDTFPVSSAHGWGLHTNLAMQTSRLCTGSQEIRYPTSFYTVRSITPIIVYKNKRILNKLLSSLKGKQETARDRHQISEYRPRHSWRPSFTGFCELRGKMRSPNRANVKAKSMIPSAFHCQTKQS